MTMEDCKHRALAALMHPCDCPATCDCKEACAKFATTPIRLIAEDSPMNAAHKAHIWMRRIQAMLNREDVKGAFLYASIHGYSMLPETIQEIGEIWREYDMLLGTTPQKRGVHLANEEK